MTKQELNKVLKYKTIHINETKCLKKILKDKVDSMFDWDEKVSGKKVAEMIQLTISEYIEELENIELNNWFEYINVKYEKFKGGEND